MQSDSLCTAFIRSCEMRYSFSGAGGSSRRYGSTARNFAQNGAMSTTRSLITGRLPIGAITGTCPAAAMSYMRVLHASTAAPSIRIPHDPQIIIRQLLRYESEPSTLSLTRSSTSRSVTHSGASSSYSRSARSPPAPERQIFSATFISIGPLGRLPARDRHRLPVELGFPLGPRDHRMAEEARVVAVREVVRPRVRAAALLARKPRLDHARGEVEQVAELERLRQVAVEDLALVLHDDVREALAQVVDNASLLQHLPLAAEDAEVLVHRLRQFVADRPRPLAVTAAEQLGEVALRVTHRRLRHVAPALPVLRRMPPRAPAEGDRLHQRVAAEAIRSVNRDAGDLAGRVQPIDRGLAPDVGVDAAHVVMGARPHRDRVVDRVDAGEDHRQLPGAVQPLEDPLCAEMTQVEHDVAVDAAALVDLRLLRSRDHVARG